jgi:predicted homoserine dehydrogenase-like protein
MAVGRRLARDVAAGSAITRDDIVVPDDSTLWRVRAEHDARFFGGD